MTIKKLTDDERRALLRAVPAFEERAKAVSLIDALTTECARLQAESEARKSTLFTKSEELVAEWRRAEAAEGKLAAAEAECERLRAELDEARRQLVADKLDSVCTKAEQRVLDAMSGIPQQDLRDMLDIPPPSQRQDVYRSVIELCRAELTRRDLKP